jgi:hypothetical protein
MAGILVAGIGIAYAGQPLNADVCVRRTGFDPRGTTLLKHYSGFG